jgi:hypothetical protein
MSASAGFLLSLLFDPEDGGDMFSKMLGFLRTTRRHNLEDCMCVVTAVRVKYAIKAFGKR